MSKSKLDIQSNMSRADLSSTNDNESKKSVQHRLRRIESKSPFDENVGDLKNQYESKLTHMRDDIQRKEREIFDLKNTINLVNLRIAKEGEAKEHAEQQARKLVEGQSHESAKVKQAVHSAEKDNHILKTKLKDMLRQVNELQDKKTQIGGMLDHKQQEVDEDHRQFTLEADEQNKRINVLHNEVKELQEQINNNNHKGNSLNNKNNELAEHHKQCEGEQAEKIFKLKSEQERLKSENLEAQNKQTHLCKDVEKTKTAIEKMNNEFNDTRASTDHEIAKLGERLGESNQVRKQLEEELRSTVRAMQEQENRIQNERNELQFMIRETIKQMERTSAEKESIGVKNDDTEIKQNEIQSENEQMLLEFEDTKAEINDAKEQKTQEINSLLDTKQMLGDKLQTAHDHISKLESNIDDSNNQYAEMKDSLEADIKSVQKKQNKLKIKFNDSTIDLKLSKEKIITVHSKTEELMSRFEFDRQNLTQEINRSSDFIANEKISIDKLKIEQESLNKDIVIVKEQSGYIDSALNDLTRSIQYAVADMTATIHNLEETKLILQTDKDILTKAQGVKSNESHNLQMSLYESRNARVRDETARAYGEVQILSNHSPRKNFDIKTGRIELTSNLYRNSPSRFDRSLLSTKL